MKAKSGRRLRAFLCSDILVLTEETAKTLYRMVSVWICLSLTMTTGVGSYLPPARSSIGMSSAGGSRSPRFVSDTPSPSLGVVSPRGP